MYIPIMRIVKAQVLLKSNKEYQWKIVPNISFNGMNCKRCRVLVQGSVVVVKQAEYKV